jgi:hypothetical protein
LTQAPIHSTTGLVSAQVTNAMVPSGRVARRAGTVHKPDVQPQQRDCADARVGQRPNLLRLLPLRSVFRPVNYIVSMPGAARPGVHRPVVSAHSARDNKM